MSERPSIVAIGAHAADMEFLAGALLVKHVREGWQAHIVHLTLGEKGSATLSASDYGSQKRREAEAAAQCLGCTPHFLPYTDGELTPSGDVVREVAVLLRKLKAKVVVAHWPGSIHGDHSAAHDVVHKAIFMAANRHFDLDGLPPAGGIRLYYADNWEDAEGFEPLVYVDISEVVEDWEKGFKCYAIGRGEGGYPYWDWYQARTRLHGIKIGVSHAQAVSVDRWRMIQRRDTL